MDAPKLTDECMEALEMAKLILGRKFQDPDSTESLLARQLLAAEFANNRMQEEVRGLEEKVDLYRCVIGVRQGEANRFRSAIRGIIAAIECKKRKTPTEKDALEIANYAMCFHEEGSCEETDL